MLTLRINKKTKKRFLSRDLRQAFSFSFNMCLGLSISWKPEAFPVLIRRLLHVICNLRMSLWDYEFNCYWGSSLREDSCYTSNVGFMNSLIKCLILKNIFYIFFWSADQLKKILLENVRLSTYFFFNLISLSAFDWQSKRKDKGNGLPI